MIQRSTYLPLLVSACHTIVLGVAAASRTVDGPVSFARDVRPILSEKCFSCHGPDANARKGGLRLDTEEGARRAITPGKPAASRAFVRVTERDPSRRMPPPESHLTLTAAQIETLRRWIHRGGKYEKHWAFVPPTRPAVPKIQNPKSKIQNPIDAFVQSRLIKLGMTPSSEAPREKLLRRVTMDLTGIPPTLAEIDAYLSDRSNGSYDRVVDRLLASPRFGERWAWEWLEAARYSDTNGYQEDRTRTMWPWRDWVINALNADMPFDQFTIEQIAGDLLPDATLSQKIATGFNRNHMLNGEGGRIPEESRVEYVVDRVDTTTTVWQGITMACARCHDHKYDPFTQREYYQLYAYFNNISESGGVDRSHSAHPVIPIPTEDQTRRISGLQERVKSLQSQLAGVDRKLRESQPEWERQALIADKKPPAGILGILNTTPDKRTDPQKKELETHFLSLNPERVALQKQLESAQNGLKDANNAVPLAMVMEDRKEIRDSFILLRGAYDKYGEKVTGGVPAILNPLPANARPNRLALAEWMVNPRNPLTARVTVNRVWQQLFGNGLVKTSEDFGVQGSPPTHPELLDWLAVEFTKPGVQVFGYSGVLDSALPQHLSTRTPEHPKPWSLKRLIKLIVMSATYKQDSKASRLQVERDPGNQWLGRGPRFRWPSFVLRDQALAVSGLLVEKVGGPSVKPYQPDGVWEDFSYGKITYARDSGDSLYRRSLYTFWRRSVSPPSMFDTSARRVCIVRTERTNTPLQALTMLNDIQFVEASRVMAEGIMKASGTPEQRISRAFRQATSRKPTAPEVEILMRGFRKRLQQFSSDRLSGEKLIGVGEKKADSTLNPAELAAYTAVCSTILNLDETVSKE